MTSVDQKIVLEALEILTDPVSEKTGLSENTNGGYNTGSAGGAISGDPDCTVFEFDKLLERNLDALDLVVKLGNDKNYLTLRSVWEKYLREELSKSGSIRWKYVQYCLKLLSILTESLKTATERDQPTGTPDAPKSQGDQKGKPAPNIASPDVPESQGAKKLKPSPNRAPPLPPDVLSVGQQKTVLTAVQFIVCLGVCPYLQPGVGVPVELRSSLGKFVSITTQERLSDLDKEFRLLSSLKVLLGCIQQPSLGACVLSRHLGDVLAILLQISYCPMTKTEGATEKTNYAVKAEEKVLAKRDNSSPSPVLLDFGNLATSAIDAAAKTKSVLKLEERISAKGDNSCPSSVLLDFSSFTPASAVDAVIAQQQNVCLSDIEPLETSDVEKCDTTNEQTSEKIVEPPKSEKDDIMTSTTNNIEKSEEDGCDSLNDSGVCIGSSGEMTNSVVDSSTETSVESSDTGIGANAQTENCVKHLTIFSEDSECYKCRLETLIDRVYQPLLVKELLLLQGGTSPQLLQKLMALHNPDQKRKNSVNTVPKHPMLAPAPAWLRKVCGHLLTETLLKPHGVHHVLRGMLDEPGGASSDMKDSDWRRCDIVAKVIAHCPKQSSAEAYYQHIAPQILTLLNCEDQQICGRFLRVGCSVVNIMHSRHPELTNKFVLKPLLQPLYLCLAGSDIPQDAQQRVIVDEKELGRCVEQIHKVFVCGLSPQASVFSSLKPLLHLLFTLYCYVKLGVSHLRSAVHEIVVTCLKQLDRSVAVTCLGILLYNRIPPGGSLDIKLMYAGITFAPGDNGGVVAVAKRIASLSEKLSEDHEGRVECLVCLLKDLEKDGLAGEFFLSMLKNLTAMIREQTDGHIPMMPQPVCLGQELREVEGRMAEVPGFDRQLLTLSLLAHVCETLGPSCLRNTKHVLQFIKVTLERGVQVCSMTDDEIFGMFESETITMAMGLLTAVMSGAFQVKKEDRETMLELCPLLEKLKQDHPDESVQEMASDLRIAVATHGAVWSSTLSKSKTEKIAKAVGDENKSTRSKKDENISTKPKIEVLEESTIEKSGSDIINQVEEKVQEKKVSKQSGDLKNFTNENSDKSPLQQAFNELYDPLIPVRGHALISLKTLVQKKDSEAIQNQAAILKIFQENLSHSDSYMYLAAVNGLSVMVDLYPDQVMEYLTQEVMNCNKSEDRKGKTSTELQLKLGECLVRACRHLGDLLPKYKDLLLPAILVSTKDNIADVRASSLSNLGEVCKLLRFSLGNHIQEIFACCGNMLKTDQDPEVRKAAGLVITMMLQGLGKDAVTVLDVVMKELYRLLKFCQTTEKDDGVLLHVGLALTELDEIMLEYLFPKQTLTKKILVTQAE